MKHTLLPLLLLALPAVAQYRPMYSTPRPAYTQPLYRPSVTPTPYQQQQLQQQQAHQNFQRMQAQQMQQMQQQMLRNQQQALLRRQQALTPQQALAGQFRTRRAQSADELAQAQQQANEQLTQLATQQAQRRQQQPATDAQQAEAQQRADARELTRLAVKNYQEVFLPGQLLNAIQALTLSPEGEQSLQVINADLLNNEWWSKQEAGQTQEKVTAYSKTLTSLTTSLLGTDLSAPPASVSAAPLGEMLARDAFDPAVANQLIREAVLAEKRLAGERLTQAVKDFAEVSSRLAGSPASPEEQKKQRNEVKKSLRRVNQELARYNARVGGEGRLLQTRKAIQKATTDYLAKTNG